jgi:hypothetical protein
MNKPGWTSVSLSLVVSLAAVVFAGCGKSDKGDKGGTGDKHSEEAPKQMTIADVLGATKKPTLVGPFASAKLGMREDEVKAAVPLFAKNGDYLARKDYGVGFMPYFAGPPADESAKKHDKRLTSLSVMIGDADVAAIKTAWGAPTAVKYHGKDSSIWLDPDAKVRAVLEPGDGGEKTLVIGSYSPTAMILGAPNKPLGLETARPFIGSTAAELAAAYPDSYKSTSDVLTFMDWSGDDFGEDFKIELRMTEGKVTSLQYWITYGGNADAKAATKAAIEAKYGAAREVKGDYKTELVMSTRPKATLTDNNNDSWVVEVGG